MAARALQVGAPGVSSSFENPRHSKASSRFVRRTTCCGGNVDALSFSGWAITTAAGSTPAQIAAATTTVNLFQTGQEYADSLNQLDLRVAKRFSVGRSREERDGCQDAFSWSVANNRRGMVYVSSGDYRGIRGNVLLAFGVD